MQSAACGQLAVDTATHRQPYALMGCRAIPLPPATSRLFTREVNRGHLVVTETTAEQPAIGGAAVLVVSTCNRKAS